MGKRGPKPKPPEIESAQGFPGRRRRETKARIASLEETEDIQDVARDSRFVPPVPCVMPRRAKALWAAVWANPANATLLKTTDHGVVARWCVLTYCVQRDMKEPPPATVEETKTTVDSEGRETATTKIKSNPAFIAWHANMRELRAVEATLGFSPASRLNVDGKLGRQQPEGGSADPGREKPAGAPSGPLGALRSHRVN